MSKKLIFPKQPRPFLKPTKKDVTHFSNMAIILTFLIAPIAFIIIGAVGALTLSTNPAISGKYFIIFGLGVFWQTLNAFILCFTLAFF